MFEIIEQQDMKALVSYLLIRLAVVLFCWGFVFIANIVDYNSGISAAKATGERIDSEKMRKTFTKVGDYYRVLIFALIFDIIGSLFTFYQLPIASILSSIAVIGIECKSVLENCSRKKSNAADIPEIIKKIVQCGKVEDAVRILEMIKKESEKEKKN